MTPVGGIRTAVSADAGPAPRRADVASHAAKTETGRALIALAPAARAEAAPHHRPQAGFLAQLIATAHQLPQTRERRRAEPEHVTAVYAGAMASPAAGRKLLRTM